MSAMPRIQYFLGANAPGGFYSLYPELLPPDTARAIYILKGGPGCGKSTLMKQVSTRMEEAGLEAEYILCSGDPDSLDAVVFPQLGVAIVDGTSPHVVEPKLPGAVERYVNLGDCYDSAALYPLRQSIMDCMAGYKGCYARAYRCLDAAAELVQDARTLLTTDELEARMARRAKGILSRELPRVKSDAPGRVRQRFLGAVTHKGLLCLHDTALAQCGRVYELTDRYGLAHELLLHLLAGITAAGYDTVACPDPMAPDRLAHLLVPELGLAFLTATPATRFRGKPHRCLRLESMAEEDLLRRSRARLRFARKVAAALTEEAITSLAQAKAMHDDLEAIYNPHVDFDRVNALAQRVGDEILSF